MPITYLFRTNFHYAQYFNSYLCLLCCELQTEYHCALGDLYCLRHTDPPEKNIFIFDQKINMFLILFQAFFK